MHQTVILTIGFFVVLWSIPDSLKFLVISTSSLALILTAYEFAIRRNNALRFLFGMRMRAKPISTGTPTLESRGEETLSHSRS
jgi:hypothetical protein